MLNHLFAFLDAQLVEPPWSLAAFFVDQSHSRALMMRFFFFLPLVSLSQHMPHSRGCAVGCRMCVISVGEEWEGSNPRHREKTGLKGGLSVSSHIGCVFKMDWAERRTPADVMAGGLSVDMCFLCTFLPLCSHGLHHSRQPICTSHCQLQKNDLKCIDRWLFFSVLFQPFHFLAGISLTASASTSAITAVQIHCKCSQVSTSKVFQIFHAQFFSRSEHAQTELRLLLFTF